MNLPAPNAANWLATVDSGRIHLTEGGRFLELRQVVGHVVEAWRDPLSPSTIVTYVVDGGKGSFVVLSEADSRSEPTTWSAQDFTLIDYDDDGSTDIVGVTRLGTAFVISDYRDDSPFEGRAIELGESDLIPGSYRSFRARRMELGDFDMDSEIDIALCIDGGFRLIHNDGSTTDTTARECMSLAKGSFDDDPGEELALLSDDGVTIWSFANGAAKLQSSVEARIDSFDIGDITDDGIDDIVFGGETGEIGVIVGTPGHPHVEKLAELQMNSIVWDLAVGAFGATDANVIGLSEISDAHGCEGV